MSVAVEYFTEQLGSKRVNRYGDHHTQIQAPGLLIGLHPTSRKMVIGGNLSIGLGVIDFDETVKVSEEKRIKFRIEKDSWIRLAYFTDRQQPIISGRKQV